MKRKFISFFTSSFQCSKRAYNIGIVKVPEVPKDIDYVHTLEICHSFTLNFVKARQRLLGNYIPLYMNNDDKYQVFLNSKDFEKYLKACGYKKIYPASLELYDVIAIYGGNGILLHSMVVLDKNKWVGTNNGHTFGKVFDKADIPIKELENLALRSVIDFNDPKLKLAGLRYNLSSSARSQLHRGENIEILPFDVYRKDLK